MSSSLLRRQLPETGVPDAKPHAPAIPPDPVADAGRLPVVEATEDEALCAAVNEAQGMSAGEGTAYAEAPHAAKEAAGRRQRAEVERRRRSQLVQNIALCEKLGIRYSTKGAARPPRRQRRLKKPSANAVPAAPAGEPASAPDALQAMAEENARLLSRVSWRRLAK